MTITVTPLRENLSFGCRINGVTDETLKDKAVRQQIFDAFEQHGMIVFEGMDPSNEMQAELRVMQRTTIKGDYGPGRFENDDQGRYRELERTV